MTRRTLLFVPLVLCGCLFQGDDPAEDGRDVSNADDVATSDMGNNANNGANNGGDASSADASMPPDLGDAGQPDMAPPAALPVGRTSDGLLLYYPFRPDPAGIARDESGSDPARDLDVSQFGTLTADGLDAQFTQRVDIPFRTALLDAIRASNAFTVEYWITTPYSDNDPILNIGGLRLEKSVSSQFDMAAGIVGIGARYTLDEALIVNEPTQIVVTGEDDIFRMYANGALIAAWEYPVQDAFTGNGTDELGLGGLDTDLKLGLLAIYDRALSPGEVLTHSLVGPRPEPGDEGVDLSTAVAQISERGVGGDATIVGRVIEADNPDGNWDGFAAATEEFGLLRFELPDAPGALVHARFSIRSYTNELDTPGQFTVWPLLRPWGADVTWTEASSGVPWEVPGARGATDRAGMAVVQRNIAVDDRLALRADVTELVRQWRTDVSSNAGVLMACDQCRLYSEESSSADRADRPRIAMLLAATPPAAPPAAPVIVAQEINGLQLNLAWMATDADVEVYVSRRLAKRTHRSSVTLSIGGEPSIVVRAVDAWGRTSPSVVIQ